VDEHLITHLDTVGCVNAVWSVMQVRYNLQPYTTVLSDNIMDVSHLASAAFYWIFGTVRTLPSPIIPHSVSTWRLMGKDR
jgi:hypothetical protein